METVQNKKKLHDKLAYFGDQLTQCPIDVF